MKSLLKMLWQRCESGAAPLCVFIIGFLFFYVDSLYDISWDIWTSRDISRALGWLEGHFHWPGPELSGGNNLPGPFFYFLLLPPLLFGSDIYSQSLLWHITWLSLTYAVVFYFLTKIIRHKESLLIFLFVFLTAMGNVLWQSLHYAWNPSFSIMFHVLSIVCLYFWRETNRNNYLYLAGLVISLGMQIHLLVSVHIITVVLFYLFERKKRDNLRPIFLFGLIVSFPFLLYNIMSYFHVFGHTTSVPEVHLRWLIQEIFSKKWIQNTSRVLHSSYTAPLIVCFGVYLWNKLIGKHRSISESTRNLIIMTAIPLSVILLFARIHWYTYCVPVFFILLLSKICDDLMPHNQKTRTNIVLAYGFFLFFVQFKSASGLWFLKIFSSGMNTYTIFLVLILILGLGALSISRDRSELNGNSQKLELWKKGILFVFLFFIGQEKIRQLPHTKKDKIPKTFSQSWPSQQKLFPIMERIHIETNWLPKEAMKRILILGIHPEISLLSYYSIVREFAKKNKLSNIYLSNLKNSVQSFHKNKTLARKGGGGWHNVSTFKPDRYKNQFIYPSSETPDGYMIIQHLQQFISYSRRDWKEYLSHSFVLSEVLKQEILQGRVLLGGSKLYNQYWLIPYSVTKESVFQKGFHNIGQPYYWEEPEWLKSCFITRQSQDEDTFYWCIVLPGYLQRAGVRIKLSDPDLKTSHSIFELTLAGPLIGASENNTNRDGFALWSDMQIRWFCHTTKFQHNLPNIGWKYIPQYPDRAKKQAEQLTAPLTLKIPMTPRYHLSKDIPQTSCKKGDIERIELTFNHSRYSYSRTHPSERMEIVWNRY